MRILFVFYNIGSGISFHSGIQVLSALAKRDGHETKLLHFHEKLISPDPNAYMPIAKEFNPDLVAFTSTDFEYQKINDIARELKKELQVHFCLEANPQLKLPPRTSRKARLIFFE